MKSKIFCAIALIASSGAAANAGQTNTVGDASGMLAHYNSVYGGSNNKVNWHTGLGGTGNFSTDSDTATASFVFSSLASAIDPSDNGGFTVDIAPTSGTSGDFYFGDTDTLRDVDFNAGDNPRPSYNSLAVAFGNNHWTSNEITMTLSPGVTAFGFSYEDIGDIGGTLVVNFSNGTSETITTAGSNSDPDRDGFIWAVADIGATITSVNLAQTFPGKDPNDGFIFYDFATIQVVPLPTAAFAGLGLLGGLGVARRILRRA